MEKKKAREKVVFLALAQWHFKQAILYRLCKIEYVCACMCSHADGRTERCHRGWYFGGKGL